MQMQLGKELVNEKSIVGEPSKGGQVPRGASRGAGEKEE